MAIRRANCDFAVKYDPSVDSPEDLTKRILYSILIGRLKNKKPAVCFIGADSGEGKSFGALRLMEILCEIQGLQLRDFMQDCNVYIPTEYPKKLDALLYEKRLKKVNMLAIHEARTVIKNTNWRSFVNQAIGDVNAMSRSVKRMMTFIISQFIKDIDSSMRYTLNYYMTITRPKGKRSRMKIQVIWKDDRDLEKPKLRKRRLSGYLIGPDGVYRRFVPSYLELNKPEKDIVEEFERQDTEAKSMILKKKMNKLLKEMELELGEDTNKITKLVDHYSVDLDTLTKIGKQNKKGFRVNKAFQTIHEMTRAETKMFEKALDQRLMEMGMVDKNE